MTSGQVRLAAFSVVAVGLIAATVLTLRDGNGDADTERVRGYLGPTPGPATSSRDYIEDKRSYLARLIRDDPERDAAALVSLTGFVPAPGAQKMTRGMKPQVVFVRFPSSEAEPLLIESTLSRAVADRAVELRGELEMEIDSLEKRAGNAQGTSRAKLDSLIAERRAAFAKVKAGCGCVYAFAVEGAEVQELRTLQSRRGVRLVDVPDPLVSDLAGWELAPLVPPP